jgi:hypothetical protein
MALLSAGTTTELDDVYSAKSKTAAAAVACLVERPQRDQRFKAAWLSGPMGPAL